MALVDCHFFSETLKKMESFRMFLPEQYYSSDSHPPYPVLYLLHGLSDDYTAWSRYTSLERYLLGKNLAVVMPDAARSMYTDMLHGASYWQYISEELPAFVKRNFAVTENRSETFVAGLSMGGYGAFKLALHYPERYGAAASLSGVLDVVSFLPFCEEKISCREEWQNIFGDLDSIDGSENDLVSLMVKYQDKSEKLPRLYASCGQEDSLFELNQKFAEHACQHNIALNFESGPGEHDWNYWDNQLPVVLQWLGFE